MLCPSVLLLNPSDFSILLLSCLSAIPVSLPSFCPCCYLLFFPLTILLIVFPTPSVATFTLCLFFLGAFLPLFGFFLIPLPLFLPSPQSAFAAED